MNVFLNKPKAKLPKILIGIVIFLILVGVLNLFQEQFKNFFYSVSAPLQKTFWSAGNIASGFLGSFLQINDITKKNQELNTKNQELLEEITLLQQVKVENQALKEVISAGTDKEFNLISASAIGIDNQQDFILIDRGSEDGILENMPVINAQKVLFGKIFKVYKNFSKIMLVSNKVSVLDVKVQKDDTLSPPIYGAIRGEGDLTAILDLVSLDYEIKNNDILITSSLEGTFPKGLLVGKVLETNKDDLKPFQKAEIELFFNLKQINKLFVISNYKLE